MIAALRRGQSRTGAAGLAGVPPLTLAEWIARGEGRDPERPDTRLYAEFAGAVREAEAQHERATLARLSRQAAKAPQIGLAILERRHRDDWSATQRVQAQVIHDVGASVTEIVDRLVARLAEIEAEPDEPR